MTGVMQALLGSSYGGVYTPWNVAGATFVQSSSVSAQEDFPTGVFFKPDGTIMYIVGRTGDDINQYSLSTAWNISTKTFSTNTTVITDPTDVFFKPDGTAFYICSSTSNTIAQYSLGTAWTTSTRTYVQEFSIAGTGDNAQGLFFSPDGLNMYFSGGVNDSVYQYTLSTAWDISTASYVAAFSVTSQVLGPFSISIRSNGRQMLVSDNSSQSIFQYTLTSPWDISTASYANISYSTTAQGENPQGIYVKPDGTGFYTTGPTTDNVYQYSM